MRLGLLVAGGLGLPLAMFGMLAVHRLGGTKDLRSSEGWKRGLNGCRSVGDTAKTVDAGEDFRFLSPNLVAVSSVRYVDFMTKGESLPGAIALVDLATEDSRRVVLENFPKDKHLSPHGIEYFGPGKRLFIMNHLDDEERVEAFDVENPTSFGEAKLKWVGYATLPVARGAGNSVAAVSNDEFYVTEWQPFGYPRGKFANIYNTNFKVAPYLLGNKVLGTAPFTDGLKSRMFRCLLSTGKCTVAYDKFVSANGIAASPDGRYIFTVDCLLGDVYVFERSTDSGALKLVHSQRMDYPIDNIVVLPGKDGKLNLHMGLIGFWDFVVEALSHDKRKIPGGFLLAEFDPSKPLAVMAVRRDVEVWHNGTIANGIATAVQWPAKPNVVVMGGHAYGGGLVKCEV